MDEGESVWAHTSTHMRKCTFSLSYQCVYVRVTNSISLYSDKTEHRFFPHLQVSDGAAAVLLSRASFAASMGLPVLGVMRSYTGMPAM